jgi:hypothetical protein
MKKINVVDSIMGSGKTSWAIQMMNETPGPFLYVTPIKTEVTRILSSCSSQEFLQPEIEEEFDEKDMVATRNKSNGLKRLLERGENIATTHALFKMFDDETVSLIKMHGYKLVLDEVMDVLDKVGKKGDSPSKLIAHGIVVAEENPRVPGCVRLLPGPEDLAEYAPIKQYAAQGRLVGVFDSMLLWLFPAETFEAFSEIWNLTYLFDGQHQKAFFEIYYMDFDRFSVSKQPDGRYGLVPHNPELDRPFIEAARKLIKLHRGPQNDIGKPDGRQQPLSVNWWSDRSGKNKQKQKVAMSVTRSWLRSVGATAGTTIWTALKDALKRGLSPKDFTSAFIPLNTRATNLYRDRDSVAYLLNKFFDPNITLFFEAMGIFPGQPAKRLMEDLFATSEMIQLIWRSAIREGKPINLFVPSERMRNLLMDWMNFNIGNLENRQPEWVSEDNGT